MVQSRLLRNETSILFSQADFLVRQCEILLSHVNVAIQNSFKVLRLYIFKIRRASIMLSDVSALLKIASILLDMGCKHMMKMNSIVLIYKDHLTLLMWLQTLYFVKGLVVCLRHLYSVQAFICFYIKGISGLQENAALLVFWSMLLLEKSNLLFDITFTHRTLHSVNRKQAQCFHNKALLLFRMSKCLNKSKYPNNIQPKHIYHIV